jgi:hypothetical protein
VKPERPNDQFVDQLLDVSLSRYSRTEPNPGLEDRVLRGVRERQREASRFAWFAPWLGWATTWPTAWRWAPIAATVTGLVIIGSVVMMHRAPQPQTGRVAGNNSAEQVEPTTPSARSAVVSETVPAAHTSVHVPRPPRMPAVHYALVKPPTAMSPMAQLPAPRQFPAPTPPTGQEMLLARVTVDADPAYLAALAAASHEGIRPLEDEIKPLEIAPLSGSTDDNAPSTDAPAQNPPN